MTRRSGWIVMVGGTLLGGCPIDYDYDYDDVFYEEPVDDAPVTTAAVTPPPISGGTLIVARDGLTAIASDPDRDVVWRVDLEQTYAQRGCPTRADGTSECSPILSVTQLEPGDEPGRVVEDGDGGIHVLLRRAGAVASFDPAFPQRVQRIPVCAEPRGIVYDSDEDTIVVACTSGDLVTLSVADGHEVRRADLGNDLRDVVKANGTMYATRFRSAQVLQLGADHAVVDQTVRASAGDSMGYYGTYEPSVAWRTIALPDGGLVMSHQLGYNEELPAFAYYSMVMRPGVTVFDQNGQAQALPIAAGVLPVDIAASRDGSQLAIALAASNQIMTVTRAGTDEYYDPYGSGSTQAAQGIIAVAYMDGGTRDVPGDEGQGSFIYQTREPASIGFWGGRPSILLSRASVADTGHQIFHTDSGQGVACASCHPEGREDGRTWIFPEEGARRTQNIAGGVLESAPFHWSGDLANIDDFLGEVFTNRMGGARLSTARVNSVARFLESVPAPTATTSASAEAVQRGDALFHSDETGCATCHSGTRLSNDSTVDVGTGEALQVPSLLGVSLRGPWMHDGCAETLAERFGGCGGDKHGHTSDLSAQDVEDILAYLETL